MNNSPIELVINQEIDAPVATVFDAWIQPEQLNIWFVAHKNMTVPESRVDLRVGGEYLIYLYDLDENTDHIVSGTYEEIIRNEKLVFNWMWQGGVDRTQVTIEFQSLAEDKTVLTLTHRGFSQQEFADKHTQGWGACIRGLVEHCETISEKVSV